MGAWITRITLFLLTNLLVVVLLGVVLNIVLPFFGIELGGGLYGLLAFSALFGFAGSFISLALSKPMAKWSTGAQVIREPKNQVEAWLLATVERQSRAAGIGMPEVAIFPSPVPNAFATGMFRNSALVAVSEGLLRGMERREVEAVLAHEVCHIANGDMVTMTLLQGVMNTFVIFLSRVVGTVVDGFLSRGEERGGGLGYWVTVLVLEVIFGVLASIVVMAFSRYREYRADAGAARLEGAPAMVAALQRLRHLQEVPDDMPKQLAAFGIRTGPAWMQLFSSHPPLEKRIEALLKV